MFKKIWTFLTVADYEIRYQLIGIRFLIGFGLLVLITPLLFDFFTPTKTEPDNSKDLDSLKLLYHAKIDSLEHLNPTTKGGDYKSNTYFRSEYSKQRTSENEVLIIKKFNLNNASAEDLEGVKGIGNVFATRIIKYRDRLGGFYSSKQLYEVYGLDSSVVQEVNKHLEGEINPLKKLKVNSEEFKQVLKHPYLEYKDVQKLFNNRPIKNKEQLCKVLPETCSKLAPYMDFD